MCIRTPSVRSASDKNGIFLRFASITASFPTASPPANMQVYRSTFHTSFPINAPIAQNNFTSPAPNTRIQNSPYRVANPISMPCPPAKSPSTPCAYPCSRKPQPIIHRQNRFGILYVLRSTTTAPNNHIPSIMFQIAHLLFCAKTRFQSCSFPNYSFT